MKDSRLLVMIALIILFVATAVPADSPRYATGFTFEQMDDYTLVSVTRPWQGATDADARQYVLYERGSNPPAGHDEALAVEVPVRSAVTMSTTFLPHFEKLGVLEALIGHDSLSWIYSPAVRDRARRGRIAEVGSGSMVDIELLLELAPDVIFTNSYGGEWDTHPYLDRAGLPTVISGDWVEEAPLGRAEWILFTGLFFDRLAEAERLFEEVEAEYLRLAEVAASAESRPTVMINAPYQGTWSISGGESYAARFIRDAGGNYLWSDDTTTGALFLDFETVFAEAADAEIWINPGPWTSLADGRAEDSRFTRFAAFENGEVYNSNRRVSESGGIDYFESGASNPHIVLADLIRIFHPDLLPEGDLYYYRKLE